MCKYCDINEQDPVLSYDLSSELSYIVFVNDYGTINLLEFDDTKATILEEVKVNYCPMCGRNLNESDFH